MKIKQFHKYLDGVLLGLTQKYASDEMLQKHQKNLNNQKSYTFLIWFLEKYAGIADYHNYITDGEDDHSFDIIFDKKNHLGERIFYIVQSKWKKEPEVKLDKDEVLRSLQEFETVLRDGFTKANDKIIQKIEELRQHRRQNGAVHFIFLTLCKNIEMPAIQENINSFEKKNPRAKFGIVDIQELYLDYIDEEYKGITPRNPFRSYYSPDEETIRLEVARVNENNRDFIELTRPFRAYIFMLRPKMVHQLFNKYGFYLFEQNVRNPLLESAFNEDIKKTALDNPDYFWYYNNGITAIASRVPHPIANEADTFEVQGLQVINGAQTVYALYSVYEAASETKRQIMDDEILITFRLIASSNKTLNSNITRYTNAQNPILDRDFWANDPIQIRLQQESFSTSFWYEKRRGEFRKFPDDIFILKNKYILFYLLFYKQKPALASEARRNIEHSKKNLLFISREQDANGLYEAIFTEDITYKPILASALMGFLWYMTGTLHNGAFWQYGDVYQLFKTTGAITLALSQPVLQRYYAHKKQNLDSEALSSKIIECFEQRKIDFLVKVLKYTHTFAHEILAEGNIQENTNRILGESADYELMRTRFEKTQFAAENIDNLVLDDDTIKNLELFWKQFEPYFTNHNNS